MKPHPTPEARHPFLQHCAALAAVLLPLAALGAEEAPAKPWPLEITQPPRWLSATQLQIPAGNSKSQMVILANSFDPRKGIPVDGSWYAIDLKPMGVKPTAKAVFLSGELIITNNNEPGIADLWLAVRAPGDKLACNNYIGQTIEASPGNGQRTNMAGWFPIINGVVEVCITALKGTTSTPPVKFVPKPNVLPAYGVNLSLQAQAL